VGAFVADTCSMHHAVAAGLALVSVRPESNDHMVVVVVEHH